MIIARGDRIWHFTIRPWVGALLGGVFCTVAVAYLAATSYLVFRDNLIEVATARQTRMQQAYEERISALRTQLDRIVSRQLVEQQIMKEKVSELLKQQAQLARRHGRIGALVERAEAMTADVASIPTPTPRPDRNASQTGKDEHLLQDENVTAYAGSLRQHVPWPLVTTTSDPVDVDPTGDKAAKLLESIGSSLRTMESEQMDRVTTLTERTYQTADAIIGAFESAGIDLATPGGEEAMGGPLVPISTVTAFDARAQELEEALDRLDAVRKEARRLPIRSPTAATQITSGFGQRRDPFLNTPAFHSGIDFRAIYGTAARAAAEGTVTHAGWTGGYGRMVEIDHGNGFVSRYAHLSKLLVHEGDVVQAGEIIGKVGSSGRSTGPHLHFEVRHNGRAVNPSRFLEVGRKVAKFL